MRNIAFVAAGVVLLAGCGGGGSGVETPEQFVGIWASDCSTPFVRFEESKIHVYPDNATYDLKSVALNGSSLDVAYDTAQGAISASRGSGTATRPTFGSIVQKG